MGLPSSLPGAAPVHQAQVDLRRFKPVREQALADEKEGRAEVSLGALPCTPTVKCEPSSLARTLRAGALRPSPRRMAGAPDLRLCGCSLPDVDPGWLPSVALLEDPTQCLYIAAMRQRTHLHRPLQSFPTSTRELASWQSPARTNAGATTKANANDIWVTSGTSKGGHRLQASTHQK